MFTVTKGINKIISRVHQEYYLLIFMGHFQITALFSSLCKFFSLLESRVLNKIFENVRGDLEELVIQLIFSAWYSCRVLHIPFRLQHISHGYFSQTLDCFSQKLLFQAYYTSTRIEQDIDNDVATSLLRMMLRPGGLLTVPMSLLDYFISRQCITYLTIVLGSCTRCEKKIFPFFSDITPFTQHSRTSLVTGNCQNGKSHLQSHL